MINFNVVDFSECRSEEVICFFWRWVYIGTSLFSSDIKVLQVYKIINPPHQWRIGKGGGGGGAEVQQARVPLKLDQLFCLGSIYYQNA